MVLVLTMVVMVVMVPQVDKVETMVVEEAVVVDTPMELPLSENLRKVATAALILTLHSS